MLLKKKGGLANRYWDHCPQCVSVSPMGAAFSNTLWNTTAHSKSCFANLVIMSQSRIAIAVAVKLQALIKLAMVSVLERRCMYKYFVLGCKLLQIHAMALLPTTKLEYKSCQV